MLRSTRSRQIVAGVLVTVVTVAVIGVVLVAMTPVGCGPANAFGLKSISNRCVKSSTARLTPTSNPSPSASAAPSGSTATPSPSPSPSAEPPSSPTASSATPPDTGPATGAYPPFFPPSSGSGNSFIPALSLNCRLPVYAGPSGSGGFIVYPGATFVADPNSSVVLPSPAPGEPSPLPGGPGYGMGYQGSLSYDRAQSKWLPVPFQWVSPDGSRYAYPSTNSIYVQDVADSAHVQLGAGHTWTIVAVLAEGVYASDPNAAGLWLLPYSGSPHQITANGYWRAAAAGAAYGTATSAVPQGASSAIIKLDLATGAISDWFGRSNSQAYPVGFDAHGHPVIQVNYNSDGSELWLTTAPSTGTPIGGSGGSYYQSPSLYGTPVGDSHGIWIPGSVPGNNGSGIALFVPGSGVYWMANIGGQLAGPCI